MFGGGGFNFDGENNIRYKDVYKLFVTAVKFQSVKSRVIRFNYISEFIAYLDNIVRAHLAQKDILWSLFIHHYVLCLASQ